MRLENSLESRIAYDRATPIWPPPDLQLDFGKIAHKTRSFISGAIRRVSIRSSRKVNAAEDTEPKLESLPRRALTIGEHHVEDENAASSAGQSDSPLFRLPLNVREEIYKQVLGVSNIHMVTIKGGQILRHMRCKCETCPGFASYVERGKWRREWTCDGTKYSHDTNRVLTQLLRTCRQIYSEAIGLLYSSNTFSFREPKILQDFVARTLPQRCASITTIHLDLKFALPPGIATDPVKYTADFDENLWKPTWDALANLPGLQNIQIRIHLTDAPRPDQQKSLTHLRQLKENESLEKCRLYLPQEFLVEQWMLEAPFEVVAIEEWEWKHDWTRKPLLVF